MAFDVLRNLPFLRHVPQRAVEVLPTLLLSLQYQGTCLMPDLSRADLPCKIRR